MTLSDCFALFVKFFFLLTPPFVMSAFLSVTKDNTIQERNTLDAFRIGTGALLFLTAVSLVRGDSIRVPSGDSVQSLAVVPMAIPITLGPASIGVLMVYGGEIKTGLGFFLAYLSISAAVICVGALLLVSNYIQKAIGKNGLVVLSKLTGLILAALSAQMIFEGADAFLLQTLEKLK